MQSKGTSLLSTHFVQPFLQVRELCKALVVVKLVLQVVAVLVHERPRAALLGVAVWANPLAFGSRGKTPRRDLVRFDLKEPGVDVSQERDKPALRHERGGASVAAPHSQHRLLERRRPVCIRAVAPRGLFVHRVDASLRPHIPENTQGGQQKPDVAMKTGVP